MYLLFIKKKSQNQLMAPMISVQKKKKKLKKYNKNLKKKKKN